MRRMISVLLIGLVVGLCLGTVMTAAAAGLDMKLATFPILLNGKPWATDKPIVTINGSTYLPLRAIGEVLGVPVAWNEGAKRVEIGGGVPTTTPAPTPASKTWQRIASWTGEGIKSTERFTTSTGEWRINWQSSSGDGVLQIFVYNADGEMVSLAANTMNAGEDYSYVRAPAGQFYLEINSYGTQWTVTVEEMR